jgi:hypothetical protein
VNDGLDFFEHPAQTRICMKGTDTDRDRYALPEVLDERFLCRKPFSVILLLFDDARDRDEEVLDLSANELVALAIVLYGLYTKRYHASMVRGR